MNFQRAMESPMAEAVRNTPYGDMTAEVLLELLEMVEPEDAKTLERDQEMLATTAGHEAREFCGGHMVAQFDERIFNAWVQQRGIEFFTKGDGVEYLTKKFPSTKTIYRPAKTTLRMPGRSRLGKRGRWACTVPCAA